MIAESLARTAERLRAGGEPYVHATVVRAEAPTSVHAGDAAIVHPDGTVEGFVGGHCALESVREQARHVLMSGDPLLEKGTGRTASTSQAESGKPQILARPPAPGQPRAMRCIVTGQDCE